MVLAGPGSGKTKVLTVKLARMLAEDVRPPRGVACITYSSECARELRKRLCELGVSSSSAQFVGTVHSFCLLNIVIPFAALAGLPIGEPITVALQSEQETMLSQAIAQEIGDNERLSSWNLRCSNYRKNYLDRDSKEWKTKDEQAASVILKYEQLLHDSGKIDFEDMVLIGLRLVEEHEWIRRILNAKFPIIAVDEYQDLGLPLHRLILSLCFGNVSNSRLLAVGDTDQSIYGFTGAHPQLLEQLSNDKRVERVQLQLNYRSRSEIVSASEHALGEKRGYSAASGDGGVIDFHKCEDGLAEQASHICETLIPEALKNETAKNLGEIAVLYPNKNIGDEIASAATESGFDFIRIDNNAPYPKTPFSRWLEECARWCSGGWEEGEPRLSNLIQIWLSFNRAARSQKERRGLRKDLVSFLFANRTPNSDLAKWLAEFFKSCIKEIFIKNVTLRDEEKVFIEILKNAGKGRALNEWSVAKFGGQMGSPDHLKLITLHSAKGLEFDMVCMMGLDQGIIPWANQKAEAKRERRRLFYVGLTRARNEVNLLCSGWTERNGRVFNNGPSEFLLEVWKKLKAEQDN